MDVIHDEDTTCYINNIQVGDCFITNHTTCMRVTEVKLYNDLTINAVRLTDGQLLSLDWATKVVPVKVTARVESKGVVIIGKAQDS